MWGAIIGGASMLMGAGSGMMGAKRQEKINDLNAMLISQEGMEEERRLQRDIAKVEGAMTAMSAASGVQAIGSRAAVKADIKQENQAQLDWLRKSARQRATSAKAGGQMQVSQLKTQAAMTGIQGFAQLSQGLFSGSQGSGKG